MSVNPNLLFMFSSLTCSSPSVSSSCSSSFLYSFVSFTTVVSFLLRSSEVCGSLKTITNVFPLLFFSPPDLESTIICNCSNLTRAPYGNHGNSAPVCKTKLKCNSHFTIVVIVIMRHSLTFLQKLLLFCFFVCFSLFICQPVITLLCMVVFILFASFFFFLPHFLFCYVCHWNSRRTLDQSRVSVAPVCVVLMCVWSCLLLSWLENIGHLIPHYHLHQSLQRLIDLCCQSF